MDNAKKYFFPMWKHLLFWGIFILSTPTANAQIGINAAYRWNNAAEWTESRDNQTADRELLADGFSLGIDYWFRLKNLRIEFLPEVNYSQFEQVFEDDREINSRFFSLFFNVNFYLLDLFNDCDCPTFSKQNTFFRKGFFLQLSPGVSYLNNRGKAFNPELQLTGFENDSFAWSMGVGAGFDLGLSDQITLTPQAGLRYYPNAEWPNLEEFSRNIPGAAITSETTSILQYYGGLRFGLRFDQ